MIGTFLIIMYVFIGLIICKYRKITDVILYPKYNTIDYKVGLFLGTVVILMIYPIIIGTAIILSLLKKGE